MNSSISVSELVVRERATPLAWRRFIRLTGAWILAFYAALLGTAVALDPYDTGFGLIRFQGTFAKGPRLAQASRVHDEAFDAAIIGNSHVMSLSPARLSALTGRHVVMLGVPGTGVPEQMTILDAYLARHSPPSALVIGVDPLYCLADPNASPPNPFPDWLYASNRFAYVVGLARLSTLRALGQRVGLMAGWIKPQPRDGTFDLYEGENPDPVRDAKRVATGPREDIPDLPADRRPGLEMLRRRLDGLPPQTRVVLLIPPVAAGSLPLPGGSAELGLATCKDAIASVAAARRGSVVLDWHRDRPETELTANFRDVGHYYEPLAKAVESDIAAALRSQE